MFYYLHIPLPDPLAQRIERFEQRYQGSSRSKPHITLIRPRALKPSASEAQLIARLRDAQTNLSGFEIFFGGLGFFGDYHTVYIRIERTPELLRYHELLTKKVQDLLEIDASAFSELSKFEVPHISIASRMTPEQGRAAWEALQAEAFEGRFLCKTIFLLRQMERHHPWESIFPLQAKCLT